MAFPISAVTISAPVYQILSHTLDELKYTSLNDLVKFVLSLSTNKSLVDDQYVTEAKRQLKIFKKIEKLADIVEPKTVIHLRLKPQLKKHATDVYLLAGLMFLNVVEIDPTNIYHLTNREIQLILSTKE